MFLLGWNKWGYPVYLDGERTSWEVGKPAPDRRRDKTRAYRRHGCSSRRSQAQRFHSQSSAYRATPVPAMAGPQEPRR